MKNAKELLGTLVFFVFLSSGVVVAQVSTGTISGTVKDSTGAVLPDTQVTILNEDTGIARTVQVNALGRYSAPTLSLGNYRVTATLQGFQTEVRRGIVLTVGREAVVDLVLTVGGVEQTIEVTGEAPLVESTTATLGSLVDERTIRDLPLNGRSYDQLAMLQPGVTLTAPGRASTGNFQYGSGARFSVGGSRPNSNSFLLDGTDVNDQANSTPGGAAGTNLGVDTIREFKILTNSFSAEFGRSSGAVMTAVTRSGTNELHSSAFEYLRNSAMDAKNFFDVGGSPPPFRRNQFGGTLGGAIQRDKTFFFGGYEGLRQGLATTLAANVPTLQARQGILPNRPPVTVHPEMVRFLNLYPLPNGREFNNGTAEFLSSPTEVTTQDNFMVRVDHQLNEKVSLFGRYTFDNDSVTSPTNTQAFESITSSRRQYATLQVNSVLGPQFVNHFHFAYNRSFQLNDSLSINELGPEFSFKPGEMMGSISLIDGSLAGIGGGIRRFFGYHLFEWADDLSYFAGKHSLKAGVNIRRIRDNTAIEQGVRGEYQFLNLADMLTGTAERFEAVPVGRSAYRGYRQTIFGVYVQDDITVSPRLTLNLGLRWEAITDPREVNGLASALLHLSDPEMVLVGRLISLGKKNFQPRVGAAWRLNDSGTTVLRFGGGVFHSQILPHIYVGGMSQAPPFYGIFAALAPKFPNGYLELLDSGSKPRLRITAPYMKTPVSYQYNLSIQQQLFEGTMVEVAYAGRLGRQLVTFKERNTPNYTILEDGRKFFPPGTPPRPIAPRRNPNFDSMHVYETNTNSLYNGVTVTLRHRSSTGFQSQAFYTFSKAMDVTSGTAFAESGRSPSLNMDPEDWKRDWGPSDFDARHNFVFNLTYPLPFRFDSRALDTVLGSWSLGSIGTFTTGLPLTPILANQNSLNGESTVTDRPDLKPGASNNPVLGGPDRYYDPAAFSRPLTGTYGNLGKNTIIGPGFANLDFSLEKSFPFRESGSVRFRAELFNIMNHPNFDLPNVRALTASGAPFGSAGRVTRTVTSSRQIQFALRINF